MGKVLKKIKIGAVLALTVLVGLTGSTFTRGALTAADGGVTIKIAPSVERITQTADISGLSGGTLSIAGAKGESEPGQIIVKPTANVASFDVTCSTLTKDADVISASNVTVYVQIYVNATPKSHSGKLGAGWYPDALIPMEYIKAKGENSIKAGENQGFMIDVKIPRSAAAGVYTGTVTLKFDGQTETVPVSLEVYDFEMPLAPPVRTSYLIWQDWLIDGELDNTTDKYRDYYEMLLDFNLSGMAQGPGVLGFPATNVNEYIACLRKYYDRTAGFAIPYQIAGWRYALDQAYVAEYLEAVARAAKEDGVNYFEKAYYYFDIMYDEPYADENKKSQFRNIIESASAAADGVISKLVTAGILTGQSDPVAVSMRDIYHLVPGLGADYDGFYGLDDISDLSIDPSVAYSGLFFSSQREFFREISAGQGVPVSAYGAVSSIIYPYSSLQIDDPLITTRDWMWQAYEDGITGDMFWCVNAYVDFSHGATAGMRYGKLNDLYRTASRDSVTNGDGYLLYPGLLYGSQKPFPSIRLMAKRDGIDDYAYLDVLDGLIKDNWAYYGQSGLSAKSVAAFINKTIYGDGTSRLDADAMYAARALVAKLIALAKDGTLITNLKVADDKISFTVYTKNGTSLSVNGAAQSGSSAGSGLRFTGTVNMPSNRILTFAFTGTVTASLAFATEAPYSMLYNYDANASGITVYTLYGSSVTHNTNSSFVRTGAGSARITLSGYSFALSSQTLSYRPRFFFNVTNFGTTGAVKFSVYNAGSTREYEVFLMAGDSGSPFAYDRVTLKANQWTEITVSNLNRYSINPSQWSQFNRVGLRGVENFVSGSTAYTQVLYLDDVYTAAR